MYYFFLFGVLTILLSYRKSRAALSASTVGGPRLLLNLRAAYFSANRDPESALGGFPRNTNNLVTKGTVGRFRLALENEVDGGDEDRQTTFGAGVWADEESRSHDGRPGSPIVLQRLHPKGDRALP